MAKFVPDVRTRRWVIISPQRTRRPDELVRGRKERCPFCPGNESVTPPEVWRIGGEGSINEPGWKVRVVPNKYQITDIHEVIIHSPDCQRDIEDLEKTQIELILTAYRERFKMHESHGQVMIFCNHGSRAGASLRHPHSQLVVVPRQINLDTLLREPLNNIVREESYFTVYCPDFSQWPYEVWIVPKKEDTNFGDIQDEEIKELAKILKRALTKLSQIYQNQLWQGKGSKTDFAYNYYIYHGKNWYLRIIPRLIDRAGFELGTGLLVNIIDPTQAAKEFQI